MVLSVDRQHRKPSHFAALVLALLLTLNLACQKKTGTQSGEFDDSENPGNFDKDFDDGGLANELGNASALTGAEKTALGNLSAEFDDVSPDAGTKIISDALMQQMKQLLADEQAGKQVAQQKMVLAGEMLKACVTRVAELAPRPGQPLTGRYKGTLCGGNSKSPAGQVFLEIIDPYDRGPGKGVQLNAPPQYKVSGISNGRMTADVQGAGKVEAQPWTGIVSDTGLNGRASAGNFENPQFKPNQKCTMGMGLENSRSPIPENYVEGMRILGLCYRQTLFLTSDVMDDYFKQLPPALAQIIKLKMLGLQ